MAGVRVGGDTRGVLLHRGRSASTSTRRSAGSAATRRRRRGPRTFDECFWPADGPQWAQVGRVPRRPAGGRAQRLAGRGRGRARCPGGPGWPASSATCRRSCTSSTRWTAGCWPSSTRCSTSPPRVRRRPAQPSTWPCRACRSGCSRAERSALTLLERLTGVRVEPGLARPPQRAIALPPLTSALPQLARLEYRSCARCARCCCGIEPDAPWPLLLAAVRDEFLDRPWDPPAAHWPDAPRWSAGGTARAGGTWLAVRRDRPAVAALLNGVRLPPLAGPAEPRRQLGRWPLALREPAGRRSFGATTASTCCWARRRRVRGLDLGRRTTVEQRADPGQPHHREPRRGHGRRSAGTRTSPRSLRLAALARAAAAATPGATGPTCWRGDGLDPADDAAGC